ncbi:type II toxin-antitoxin system RelE/ParE family toxin [Deinococcus radiopugnans]|uniref:Type II toxin-antitoxin system RelE/ParE family toxin n=1 Tax=Deinococcus radiopugnans ATCC 19172 TaxID=585398 RepID=A0A5C4Y4G5_9DEIO|nr:type II toxin-antitoxin system RelE/ParE family toxin [Deinococcus radiopugnans]MBB6017071.1 hypothetical protein [Deinococcus radiopugnans ATCC 19172]TNM70695.1 hypothetical protein FHR04_12405 [Deinococcus radiopugnans ATCC 19172]
MPFVLYRRPNARRAAILDDLLAMADTGQQDAVNTAITMLSDLFEHGHRSSYAQKLQGLPIWELKSHARGGAKGSTRIYFYFRRNGDVVIVNAEIKAGNAPSAPLLREAALTALQDGQRS